MQYFKYLQSRANAISPHEKHRIKKSVPNVGCILDPTDRGQPNRFEKWYKIPRKAHQLYWRTRGLDKWWIK